MNQLTKDQAKKITELTSSVFPQGSAWVMQETDLETGVQRLTRGLTEKVARQKLKNWRKERMEQLLRSTPDGKAYILRAWHENPGWNGDGVWQWAQNSWYTSREDAEKALEKVAKKLSLPCEIYETATGQVPGHFVVS